MPHGRTKIQFTQSWTPLRVATRASKLAPSPRLLRPRRLRLPRPHSWPWLLPSPRLQKKDGLFSVLGSCKFNSFHAAHSLALLLPSHTAPVLPLSFSAAPAPGLSSSAPPSTIPDLPSVGPFPLVSNPSAFPVLPLLLQEANSSRSIDGAASGAALPLPHEQAPATPICPAVPHGAATGLSAATTMLLSPVPFPLDLSEATPFAALAVPRTSGAPGAVLPAPSSFSRLPQLLFLLVACPSPPEP